jgi:hypothetical protein
MPQKGFTVSYISVFVARLDEKHTHSNRQGHN